MCKPLKWRDDRADDSNVRLDGVHFMLKRPQPAAEEQYNRDRRSDDVSKFNFNNGVFVERWHGLIFRSRFLLVGSHQGLANSLGAFLQMDVDVQRNGEAFARLLEFLEGLEGGHGFTSRGCSGLCR